MATQLEVCARNGHNFVLSRDGCHFSCSHGCGETRARVRDDGVARCGHHVTEPTGTNALVEHVGNGVYVTTPI